MKLFELYYIPRSKMPQISAEDIVDVYPFKKGDVSLSKMKPVQKDRLEKKHKEAKQKIESNKVKPIVLDKSGRIVNGHHRYDVYKELGHDKVPAIIVDASLEELMDRFKHTAKEEGGAGAGGGAAGGTGGSAGGSTGGGDGGATSSSGDSGSADSGDAGDSGSDSAEATPTPAPSRGYFIGSMAPYKKSKKKKKKKKKQGFDFGQGVYEDEIEFKSDIGTVLEKCWNENFADGKVKGKSRPGRVKKAGASCKGSVTSLRAKAKKYSGEKGKMYHWCANMKAGKKK